MGLQSAFSTAKRCQEKRPLVALSLGQIAESDSQQDPTFKTSLAYNRLTATSALEKLKEHCSCFFTFYKPIPSSTFLAVNITLVDLSFMILISYYVLPKDSHPKKLTQQTNASLDSLVPGRGIKTLSKANKHSYPHLALPYPTQSSLVAGTLVGNKNGDLSINEVKSYAKDAKGVSELNGLV